MMIGDDTSAAAKTFASVAVPPSVDLLHSTTSTDSCLHRQNEHRHHLPRHLGHQLHCHCESPSSSTCVGDVGGGHTQTASDSDAEGCHTHCCCSDTAAGHATADNDYLQPR